MRKANCAGAFEGSEGTGLSFNAFLKWSKQLPALLNSLKSLLATGNVDTANVSSSASPNVRLPALDVHQSGCSLFKMFF